MWACPCFESYTVWWWVGESVALNGCIINYYEYYDQVLALEVSCCPSHLWWMGTVHSFPFYRSPISMRIYYLHKIGQLGKPGDLICHNANCAGNKSIGNWNRFMLLHLQYYLPTYAFIPPSVKLRRSGMRRLSNGMSSYDIIPYDKEWWGIFTLDLDTWCTFIDKYLYGSK